MADIEQQARELLASEYDKAGEKIFASRTRSGRYDNDPDMRAIAAALRAAPEGFALVPIEPTEDMVEAYHGVEAVTASNDEDAEDQWAIESYRAMIAARPTVTPPTDLRTKLGDA